jgi:hypothetical protein
LRLMYLPAENWRLWCANLLALRKCSLREWNQLQVCASCSSTRTAMAVAWPKISAPKCTPQCSPRREGHPLHYNPIPELAKVEFTLVSNPVV